MNELLFFCLQLINKWLPKIVEKDFIYYNMSSNGSTQILKCSKYPISLRGELAVSEAILIHR